MSCKSTHEQQATEKGAALQQTLHKGSRPREPKAKSRKGKKQALTSSSGELDSSSTGDKIEVHTYRNLEGNEEVPLLRPSDDKAVEVSSHAASELDAATGRQSSAEHENNVNEGSGSELESKDEQTADLHTIFSGQVTVKFCHSNGKAETLVGRWCTLCRDNEEFVVKKGEQWAFHVGGNSLCWQHIRSHFDVYEERCEEKGIPINHHAILWGLVKKQAKRGTQQTLEDAFQKVAVKEFSRDEVLKAVAEFVVCDNQSLAIADKATFRNCLVSMRPNSIKADIPTTHTITLYIHNQFVKFIDRLKETICQGSYNWASINNDRSLPSLWHAIPVLKELQTAWESKRDLGRFMAYETAIDHGLQKINKYYNKFDNKPVYILSLVLHPYYKLAYIKMVWGGPEDHLLLEPHCEHVRAIFQELLP
ncbi:hypothetical protein APHAL10511_003400 [Amanita phalloides]|nr:hypothetical protein APHAL10511_003400 [Amanita phalloides]